MKKIQISFSLRIQWLLYIVLSIISLQTLSASDTEIITNIILINRQAELVDMNKEGEIIKRYVVIHDYFSSGRSHKSTLRRSLQSIKDYGQAEDYFLPGSSKLPGFCLQSFMMSHTLEIPTNCEISDYYTERIYFSNSEREKTLTYLSSFANVTIYYGDAGPLLSLTMLDFFYPREDHFEIQDIKQRKLIYSRFRNGGAQFT